MIAKWIPFSLTFLAIMELGYIRKMYGYMIKYFLAWTNLAFIYVRYCVLI